MHSPTCERHNLANGWQILASILRSVSLFDCHAIKCCVLESCRLSSLLTTYKVAFQIHTIQIQMDVLCCPCQSISYGGDKSIVFQKKIKKAILMRGVQGFWGGQIIDFFIPRVKSPRFDPMSKYLTLGGQYCIILHQWIMFSSLREILLCCHTRFSARDEWRWYEFETFTKCYSIGVWHPHQWRLIKTVPGTPLLVCLFHLLQ